MFPHTYESENRSFNYDQVGNCTHNLLHDIVFPRLGVYSCNLTVSPAKRKDRFRFASGGVIKERRAFLKRPHFKDISISENM